MKTGSDTKNLTARELLEQANRLTQSQKNQIAFAQLQEILSDIFTQNIPLNVLLDCKFSVTDDAFTRSKKFIQLGTDLQQHFREISASAFEKNLIYQAYKSAFEELLSIQNSVEPFAQIDYYTSLAQIARWAKHHLVLANPDNTEEAHQLELQAQRYLEIAYRSIETLPSSELMAISLQSMSNAVYRTVQNISIDELSKLAINDADKVSMETADEMEQRRVAIVDSQVKKAEEKLRAQSLDKSIIASTLEKFRVLKTKKMNTIIQEKTMQEKRATILSQSLKENIQQLIGVKLANKEDFTQNDFFALHFVDYFKPEFRFETLDRTIAFIENTKKTFSDKIQKEMELLKGRMGVNSLI